MARHEFITYVKQSLRGSHFENSNYMLIPHPQNLGCNDSLSDKINIIHFNNINWLSNLFFKNASIKRWLRKSLCFTYITCSVTSQCKDWAIRHTGLIQYLWIIINRWPTLRYFLQKMQDENQFVKRLWISFCYFSFVINNIFAIFCNFQIL